MWDSRAKGWHVVVDTGDSSGTSGVTAVLSSLFHAYSQNMSSKERETQLKKRFRTLRVLTLHNALGPVVIMCVKMIGDVDGRTVLMFDDMISTAGTVCEAAKLVTERGAKDVIVSATHPVLVGLALDVLRSLGAEVDRQSEDAEAGTASRRASGEVSV